MQHKQLSQQQPHVVPPGWLLLGCPAVEACSSAYLVGQRMATACSSWPEILLPNQSDLTAAEPGKSQAQFVQHMLVWDSLVYCAKQQCRGPCPLPVKGVAAVTPYIQDACSQATAARAIDNAFHVVEQRLAGCIALC